MKRQRRARGVTLIELLISLVVIVVGMLVIFRVLSTSVAGGMTSSHVAQAQQRADAIIEAIRMAPTAAITCLATTAASGWQYPGCEQTCLSNQLTTSQHSTCIFTPQSFAYLNGPSNPATGSAANQLTDRTGWNYFLFVSTTRAVPAGQFAPATYGTTYVRLAGDSLRTAEISISIGWNDDNTMFTTGIGPGNVPYPNHTITLITGLAQ